MSAGASLAFTIIRVPRGAPPPSEEACRRAITEDRRRLRLPAMNGRADLAVAGPYAVTIDGTELDEYTVWEK
jgi:hypothetical protein